MEGGVGLTLLVVLFKIHSEPWVRPAFLRANTTSSAVTGKHPTLQEKHQPSDPNPSTPSIAAKSRSKMGPKGRL
jgi:hypothetical protein